MSSKSKKRAALAALKSARNGTSATGAGLDAMEFDDVDDVYETMDEERYREYVEGKQDREDFVVDDDGLGYHDDGDYDILGAHDDDDAANSPNAAQSTKKGKGANALTKDALKKARKNKALAAATANGAEEGKSQMKMWDFVNKGIVADNNGGGERKVRGGKSDGREDAVADDLADIMNGLDDAPAPRGRASGARRTSAGSSRRRSASRGPSGARHGNAGSGSRKRHRSVEPASSRSRRTGSGRQSSHGGRAAKQEAEVENDNDDDMDFGGDGHAIDFDDAADAGGDEDAFNQERVEENTEENGKAAAEAEDGEMEDKNNDDKEDSAPTEASPIKEQTRSRPGRPAGRLAGRLSQAAARAKEAQDKKAAQEAEKLAAEEAKKEALQKKEAAAIAKNNAAKIANKGSSGEITMDTSSMSFQPTSIAAAGTSQDAGGAGGMDLERIVMMEAGCANSAAMKVDGKEGDDEGENKKETEKAAEPRPYLDIYWLDASERNGVVSLYGKVKVPIENKTEKGGEEFVYQSCCVTIPNNERNLFVLPRLLPTTKSDGDNDEEEQPQERHSIGDVYAELKSILTPSCIPHIQGANWKAKPVMRSYAFEDPSIPREKCQYLKVVYDGKFPVPDRHVCVHGGKSFEKILGGGASNLENFLIKRRLMGPGWVRIYNPKPLTGGNVSWCKWECTVEGPKSLKRLDLVSSARNGGVKVAIPLPPPVSTVSIKFKTVVNPKSHKMEIVCVSAVCHSNVLLDSASDEGPEYQSQLTLVRPLNFDSNGTMAQFPRDMEKEIKEMPGLSKSPNERALLSRLFAQLGTWDPDVIVSHNGWGHDIDVLLNRCVHLKVSMWSKIGRRRQMRLPHSNQFGNGKDWAIANALDGRLLCDTCLSAKEFVRETTYSLDNLAKTQLKASRVEIEPVDVPKWTKSGAHFVALAKHTLNDAQLVQGLMFKLQVLPLTKQLTNIAGNLWGRTMKGNRAERNEFLLLHEFHQLKYLVPEKRSAKQRDEELLGKEGATGSSNKPKYSGGLVLEPKKGLYDSFILLLDFNSLYPSLIQEYNLCFTTMEWSKSNAAAIKKDAEGGVMPQGDVLPPLPDESLGRGVLPRVIKTLVDRRRNVKKFMKSEKDADKKEELNIRQLALKLTANSMYGCLGFSHSRFYAQPIAALVTAMGRETLQRTVDLTQTTIGLEVIYGDTDSIMINTRITDMKEYSKVLELGNTVKREVNKLYKTLELEIDGVFRSMLLLKKKKYAAVTISEGPGGKGFTMGTETKGLDLVRRDWSIQSKDSGQYVLDQILSGDEKEVVVNNIHNHLEEVAKKMRSGELPLDKYVITKGLNKHPNDYPDARTLPHVHVAKMMLKDHRAVSIGDHIPYVITSEIEKKEDGQQQQQQQTSTKKAVSAERARHPDEIARSNGTLQPDVEWYLMNQILPPISRLCEPIEGTSPGILAEKLGLDSSKYNALSVNIDDDDIVDYTPASCLPDEDRFKDVEKFVMTCVGCNTDSEFPGVFSLVKDSDSGMTFCQSGLRCPNPQCDRADNWGESDMWSCVSKILNKMNLMKKEQQKIYYDGLVRCDDPMCSLETRQLSVYEGCCLKQGCNGRMKSVYTESALQTQLKYFDSLFDIAHACKQLKKSSTPSILTEKEITKSLAKEDKEAFQLLHGFASHSLNKSGYNFVSGNFFQNLFGVNRQ
mmetsp:Transcript_8937/g.20092  ORF Transcript_8937/g.20092 Transcript_8937/m.20092 type:complete len:1678 (-) Transcript_8937:137-5170(-)